MIRSGHRSVTDDPSQYTLRPYDRLPVAEANRITPSVDGRFSSGVENSGPPRMAGFGKAALVCLGFLSFSVMKTYNVSIKGLTPFLQCRFSEEASVESSTRRVVVDRGTPRQQAEKLMYRDAAGKYYFPSTCICRCIAEAGRNHKMKGSRSSARYVVPAAIMVPSETIILNNGDGRPAKDFEVDSRPVSIPSTKGRVMRHRPRFDEWSATFALRVNDNILPSDFIKQLLDEAGLCVGIGDFRPQRSGPFGTFTVTKWEELK